MKSETWQRLLVAADELSRLAPWTWMHDSQLVGLRDPSTGEKLLCSILGRLREVFGVIVYRRPAGRRWVLNAILDSADPTVRRDQDTALDQDCLKVEFVVKRELDGPDRAVLTTAGFAPKAKRGPIWPTFRSMLPGGYPWFVTQEEAEMLVFALPRVAAFAILCRDTPGLKADLRNGEVANLPEAYDPAAGPLQPADLDWQPEIIPPEPPPVSATLDEATIERLASLPQPKGLQLEVDIFYGPSPVSEGDRPFFPKTSLAVESTSGLIAGFRLGGVTDQEMADNLTGVIQGALVQLGARPERLCVQRQRVAQMLLPLAQTLGISLQEVPRLPALGQVREELMRRF
ncbi:MAG: hypothetical protein U1G07_07320 [Verrucomicrobiota bacterium]